MKRPSSFDKRHPSRLRWACRADTNAQTRISGLFLADEQKPYDFETLNISRLM
jgi:hypothetical protein